MFALYPVEQHWWSFSDYRAVRDTVARLQATRVLEFGPGSSTLALMEGGATRIDTCEDAPDWAEVYEGRLQAKYREVVRLHRYTWADPLTIPGIDEQTYDLALVDGPLGTGRRPVVVEYCMARCAAVLVPTEDSKGAAGLRPFLREAAARRGWSIAFEETGPLSGGFALLQRPIVTVTPTPMADPWVDGTFADKRGTFEEAAPAADQVSEREEHRGPGGSSAAPRPSRGRRRGRKHQGGT